MGKNAYTTESENRLMAMHALGHSYEEIAEALGLTVASVKSKAQRLRQDRKRWPDNKQSVRRFPRGAPGRPCNRDRPKQVGVRLAKDVIVALHEFASGDGIGVTVTHAILRAAKIEGLTVPAALTLLQRIADRDVPEIGAGRSLVCTPRGKQLSAQVPSSVHTLVTRLAAKQGKSVSSTTAAAVQSLLADAGFVLTDRNV